MGDLLSDIQRHASTGRRSTLNKILTCLDQQDRDDLIAAIDDDSIPAAAIRAALAKRSLSISLSAIYRYRNGEVDYGLE